MHFTPTVESLPSVVPFVGPETQERTRGRKFRARIGANESVFGPSPRAVEAMQYAATEVWKYCDPENYDLKQALAVFHGVGPQNIVVGEGIDGLFGYTVRLFVDPGVTVASSRFPTMMIARTRRRSSPLRSARRRAWSTSPIRTTRWLHGGMPPRSSG
jgi:histidinol-phosphate/aromatic aminotransferase/cobyric acid decarboxylase-like protein